MEFRDQVLDFSKPLNNSDQILVVEGQEFHIHRTVLGLWSPVFNTMFNSDFKEAAQDKIELPYKKADIFRSFLLLLYSPDDMNLPENTWMTEENYQELLLILKYIREYQAGKALQSIEKRLYIYVREMTRETPNYISSHVLKEKLKSYMMLLHLADQFELKKVTDTILPHIKYFSRTSVTEDRRFNLLSSEMKYTLMSEIACQLETSLRTSTRNICRGCNCCKKITDNIGRTHTIHLGLW